jgi:hypothetical protein
MQQASAAAAAANAAVCQAAMPRRRVRFQLVAIPSGMTATAWWALQFAVVVVVRRRGTRCLPPEGGFGLPACCLPTYPCLPPYLRLPLCLSLPRPPARSLSLARSLYHVSIMMLGFLILPAFPLGAWQRVLADGMMTYQIHFGS